MSAELPPTVARTVGAYLDDLDRHLPGRLVGFHVVGSVALGAFHPRRSDIDFVAVVDRSLTDAEVRQMRAAHVRCGARNLRWAATEHRSPLTQAPNGLFVRAEDLGLPVSQIVPVAAQVGTTFTVGRAGSDLSPVGWQVLAERGIAVRGSSAGQLGLDVEAHTMTAWNLTNLDTYWRPWAERVLRHPGHRFAVRPRHWTAWGATGPVRLHHTVSTGRVIAKETAAELALDHVERRWHPLLRDALAYRRDDENDRLRMSPSARGRLTAEFVLHVIDATHAIS